MIVISVLNMELIMAKEGTQSPVGRAVLGHWIPALVSTEASNGRDPHTPLLPELSVRVTAVAYSLQRTQQQENYFPVQFFLLLKNSKA